MPEYLPRTSTFVYTLLRFQSRYRPVLLARRLENLDEFPLGGEICDLGHSNSALARFNDRFPILPVDIRDPYPRRLAREARRHDCVLVHAHFGWSGSVSLIAARRLGLPLVTSFYGRDLADKKRRWQRRDVYDTLFRGGTLFICEGPAMADHMARLGCPPEKVRVVPIGVDLEQFPFEPAVRTRPLVIAQAARLVEKKGVDLSIQAFAAARPDLGAAELWIIGGGPIRPELESLVGSLGVSGSVRFLGELSHSDYRDVLRRVHVGIQPSRTASDGDTEGGAPTVLIEMQARGIPVIATRHADIPFVVSDDECLVDEGDVEGLAEALVRVAGLSEREWERRTVEARDTMEARHDAAVVAGLVEDVYAEAQALVPASI